VLSSVRNKRADDAADEGIAKDETAVSGSGGSDEDVASGGTGVGGDRRVVSDDETTPPR
jgi:hypothetical protein